MYKERVVASKACQKKWDENAKKIHAEKLKHIKPSIDNSPPQTQVHLENRRKRDQIVEDRLTTIEKHNLILLERMMTIMKRPSSLDNNNTRSKSPSKSLNREAKKRELEKINAENQIILKKLTKAKAYYDHNDWDTFQKNQELYLKNICEYPVQKSQSNTQTLPKIHSQGSSREKSMSSPERRSAPTTTSEKKKTKGRFTKGTIEAHKEWSSSEKKYFSDNDNDNDSLMLSDLDSDDDDLKESNVETKKKAVGTKKAGGKDKVKGKGGKDKGKDATKDDELDGGSSGSESLGSDFSDSFDNESDDDEEGKSHAKDKKETEKKDNDTLSNSNSLAASEEKNSTILSPGSRHQEEYEKDEEEYKPQEEDEEEKSIKAKEEKEEKEDSDLDGLDGDFEDDPGDKSDSEL